MGGREPTFGILGPLIVQGSGGPITVRSATQRLLLARLLVEPNRTVSADRLIDTLWDDELPMDPAAALRTQVSRLRRTLGPEAEIVNDGTGYRLSVAPDDIDADRFTRLVAEADARPSEARRALDEAIALWRGVALEEFADRAFAPRHATRLEELRAAAEERRAGLLLDDGRPMDAAAALEALLARHPEREHARGTLMQALYRLGRHTDALHVFQSWRQHLAEERGLAPSPELEALEAEILRHTLPRQHSVPRPVSSFVGREDDVRGLTDLLGRARLVTLWGPGGVGKTRLALELAASVAERYPDGVHVCDLAAVGRSTGVARAVATRLGVEEQQLVERLAGRRVLLVLDGCEHVLRGAGPLVARVVQATHAVDVLATSRERLGVDGEHVWEVQPLAATGPHAPAVELFVDRARATSNTFAADDEQRAVIADICASVDGLPLAIEFAAARTRAFSLRDLRSSLDHRLDILGLGDRSLRAVLDWSYEQLDPVEQRVLDSLAVFRGPFDLSAAQVVAEGDVTLAVLRLLDRALVVDRRDADDRRFALLDTTREYGRERLQASGRLAQVSARHAEWAVAVAERANDGLRGADEPTWARVIHTNLDELRAAHAWLVGHDPDTALRLVVALRSYALWRGHSEIFRWADVAVAATAGGRSPLLAEALLAASTGAWQRGDLERADAASRSAAEVAATLDAGARRAALEARADVDLLAGRLEASATAFVEAAALAEAAGDDLQATWDIGSAALAHAYAAEIARADELASETMTIARRAGAPSALAFAHYVAGEISSSAGGDTDEAEAHLLSAIRLAEQADSRFVAGVAEVTLASCRARHADVDAAVRHCTTALTEWHRSGAWTPLWVTMRTVVALLVRLGRFADAACLYGAMRAAGRGTTYGADAVMLHTIDARLRSELDEPAYAAAAAEGAAMTDDAVVALALSALGAVVTPRAFGHSGRA